MLMLEDLNLMEQCSKGEVVLLIAPENKEFENDTKRIMIEGAKITIITVNGEEHKAVISLEYIAAKIRNDEWEIRETFTVKEKSENP